MKHGIFITLAATGIAAMMTFANCKKNLTGVNGSSVTTQAYTSTTGGTQTSDRIDAIVKDLSLGSYSFSFDKPMPNAGITRTAYGADNYLVFADPQDVICGNPIILRYPRIPIWKRPVFIQPTCPDMAIDVSKLMKVKDLLASADPAQYGVLRGIKISNGGTLLATDKFTRSFASLQLDKFDAITKDLNPSHFLMLGAPDNTIGGAFTRNFYGYADLNALLFKPYETTLKDIIKPTLKGCFDPQILKIIRERLIQFNPEVYKELHVTPLKQNKSLAVLQ